jgi:integrase
VVDALVVRWGGLDVAQVTPYVVQQWVADEAARGQAPATVQRNLGTVKAIMAAGAAWGMVTQDHLAAIRAVPGPRVAQRVPRYLSHAEAGALIAACRGRVRLLVVLALATGCRYAELMALRWDQVGDGVLHVRQSLKGGRGRDVPLDEATMRELERWRDGGEWVFASTYKRRGHADSLTRGWDEARKESGVRCRFHDLRHTAASWLVMDGVPLYVVQALLGHGSQRMTERYAHLSPTHPMQVLRSVSRAHLWHTAPKRKGKKKAPGSAPGA